MCALCRFRNKQGEKEAWAPHQTLKVDSIYTAPTQATICGISWLRP